MWHSSGCGKKASRTVLKRPLDKITGNDENGFIGPGVNVRWYWRSGVKTGHHAHATGFFVFMD
jgi:hypothetical protein